MPFPGKLPAERNRNGRNRLRFSARAVHQHIFWFESSKAVNRATEALSPSADSGAKGGGVADRVNRTMCYTFCFKQKNCFK